MVYKGYVIIESKGHGKSVKGTSTSKSIQVQDWKSIKGGYLALKHFSFPVGNEEKKAAAIQKAKTFVDNLKPLTFST